MGSLFVGPGKGALDVGGTGGFLQATTALGGTVQPPAVVDVGAFSGVPSAPLTAPAAISGITIRITTADPAVTARDYTLTPPGGPEGAPVTFTGTAASVATVPSTVAGTYTLMLYETKGGTRTREGVATVTVQAAVVTQPGQLPTVTIVPRSSIAAGMPVFIGHAFARSDVQSGQYLTLTPPGGSAVAVSTVQQNVWPADNSLRFGGHCFRTPVALTAGSPVAFQLGTTSTAPSGTPVTLAQVRAATDFHTFLSGYDCGADTFTISFNDITQNLPLWNGSTGFGNYPLGGYEIVSSSPHVSEWHAWRFLKRDSDGASHRFVQVHLYVRAYSDGAGGIAGYHVTPSMRNSNTAGPHPSGTVGPTVPTPLGCVLQLYNSSTLMQTYGGAGDARTVTVTDKTFDTTHNTITLSDGQNGLYYGSGVAYAFSGPGVPAGVAAVKYAWNTNWGNAAQGAGLSTTRSGAHNGPSLTFGAAGSGAATISPVSVVFPRCGWYGILPDGTPPWFGTAPAPLYYPAHDVSYLTRRTRLVPPYVKPDAAHQNQPVALGSGGLSFYPGVPLLTAGLDGTGDDVSAEHIGYLSLSSVRTLLNPLDVYADRQAAAYAWQWGEYPIWFTDERTGKPFNFAPSTAPYLSPPNPDLHNPQLVGLGSDTNWYQWSYGGLETSHLPSPYIATLLRTAHAALQEVAMYNCVVAPTPTDVGNRNMTINGIAYENIALDYYNIQNSERSGGWSCRMMGCADRMMADSDPMRPVVKHVLDQNAAYCADPGAPRTPNQTDNGVLGTVWTSIQDAQLQPDPFPHRFMLGIIGIGLGMEAWVGDRPGWRIMVDRLRPALVDIFWSGTGGSSYRIDDYTQPHVIDANGVPYTSVVAMIAGNYAGQLPFPATGIGDPGAMNSAGINLPGDIICARTGMAMFANLDNPPTNAVAAIQELDARMVSVVAGGLHWSSGTEWYPTWAIAQPGQ